MDLTTAQTHLTESLAALSKARQAQAYGIGGRSMQRASIVDLQGQVTYWQRVVESFQLKAAGVSSSSGAKTASFR